jgi:hypothetical protein
MLGDLVRCRRQLLGLSIRETARRAAGVHRETAAA